jgi:transposase
MNLAADGHRPPTASARSRYSSNLGSPPSDWGYSTHIWTVALLAGHLERRYGCPISPRTLRRRMRAMGLRWKRPRYVFSEKAPHLPQKKEHLSVG